MLTNGTRTKSTLRIWRKRFQVANGIEVAPIRFLLGTGFRIGESAVAE